MPRITPVLSSDDERTTKLLDETQQQLGRVPNLYRAMVNSPAVLSGYLGFRSALSSGALPARLREQLALVVASSNDCEYCIAAHRFRGSKIGLDIDELDHNAKGHSSDPRTAAALTFAAAVTASRGKVNDRDIEQVKAAGFDETEIAEIIGHVALNTFSNWFSSVAEPELDFPEVLR